MRHNPTPRKPKFQAGSQIRLLRYLPPVLSGSIVAVLAVRDVGHGQYRYQVQSSEYPGSSVWAHEEDLAYPMEIRL